MKKPKFDKFKSRTMGQYLIVGWNQTASKPNELPYVDPWLFESGFYKDAEDYADCVRSEVLGVLEPTETE